MFYSFFISFFHYVHDENLINYKRLILISTHTNNNCLSSSFHFFKFSINIVHFKILIVFLLLIINFHIKSFFSIFVKFLSLLNLIFTKKTYLQKVIQVNTLKVHINKEIKTYVQIIYCLLGIGFGNKTWDLRWNHQISEYN
jgi:hypothetical protein